MFTKHWAKAVPAFAALSVTFLSSSAFAEIHGSGIAEIHGSGTKEIHGSGVHEIHGSGIAEIHGSGVHEIHGSGIAEIHGSGALVLSGPVESIDRINGLFTAMGQFVVASQSMLSTISPGDFVDVSGTVMASGWLYADEISVGAAGYVPGADAGFVRGIPSSVDYSLGRATMGDLTIDFSAADISKAGGLWTLVGIQPNSRGVLISEYVD
jgi:hypothetical protein